jgi:hypothetical protein
MRPSVSPSQGLSHTPLPCTPPLCRPPHTGPYSAPLRVPLLLCYPPPTQGALYTPPYMVPIYTYPYHCMGTVYHYPIAISMCINIVVYVHWYMVRTHMVPMYPYAYGMCTCICTWYA